MKVYLRALVSVLAAPVLWALSKLTVSRREAFAKFHVGMIVADASARVETMRGELEELGEAIQAIIDEADEANEDLSDDDLKEIKALEKKATRLKAQIEAREVTAGITAGRSRGRRAAPIVGEETDDEGVPTAAAGRRSRAERSSVPAEPKIDKETLGFTSLGQFAAAVQGAVSGERVANERFQAVATTYGNETVGADGGFLVPTEFRDAIWQKVGGEDSLMSRCEEFITGSNNMSFPKDETTPWDQSTGIQAYWSGEGKVIDPSKAVFETESQRLDKLTALVPVSEEMLEDTIALESYLRVKTPQKMVSKINTAIVRGNGVGQPLGYLNSDSFLAVAKEAGQAADTIKFENISKMWARMWAPSRRNAIWLINQDIEPQLDVLGFPTSATAVPMYMPAGGLSGSPLATLKGRPVLPIEPASTLGDLGDISLVDLTQYAVMKKAGEIREDVSMHLYFDQDITAYRFVFRLTGKPLWNSVITPENGTQTRSWAVGLAERA